jgi:hypothetical protein
MRITATVTAGEGERPGGSPWALQYSPASGFLVGPPTLLESRRFIVIEQLMPTQAGIDSDLPGGVAC